MTETEAKKVRLTMLNSMGGAEFPEALDRMVSWGIDVLDLKDAIFGKAILDLNDEQLIGARDLIAERDLAVHCLSTVLFHDEIEKGREAFEADHLSRVQRAIEAARVLSARFIRLLSAKIQARGRVSDSTEYILQEYPWVMELYGEAVDRIAEGGFEPTIENETHGCIWSNPAEITSFFAALGRSDSVSFTWDVQNLWQGGTFPTAGVYEALRGVIGYYHVKGGQCEPPDDALRWRSSLGDASWPVADITGRVVADGVSDVICLNPSHGKPKDGYDYTDVVERDLNFLRSEVPGIE